LQQGCEIGMYPYVIPFSGAALANDPALLPHTQYAHRFIAGTPIEWDQPAKILPIDPLVSELILRIERNFESELARLQPRATHLPSRMRSLVWILAAAPIMAEYGMPIAAEQEVRNELEARLPQLRRATASRAVVSA
jgi:hypothetical protein